MFSQSASWFSVQCSRTWPYCFSYITALYTHVHLIEGLSGSPSWLGISLVVWNVVKLESCCVLEMLVLPTYSLRGRRRFLFCCGLRTLVWLENPISPSMHKIWSSCESLWNRSLPSIRRTITMKKQIEMTCSKENAFLMRSGAFFALWGIAVLLGIALVAYPML